MVKLAFLHVLQHRQRLYIEFAQQRCLPRIPNVGPDASNVGIGEQIEHLEIVNTAHRLSEVTYGFLVFQIAAKSGISHQQMMPNQEFHQRAVVDIKPHAIGDLAHHHGAPFGMTATEAFADIV